MRLIHFDNEPVELVPRSYPLISTDKSKGWYKPNGLWVSDEEDACGWSHWCKSEDFCLSEMTHAHEVILKKETNILILDTTQKILAFNRKYGLRPYPEHDLLRYIDWKEVREKYQGILITPYNWDLRLDHRCHWYYTWDWASGCIWDLTAIESFKEIPNEFI